MRFFIMLTLMLAQHVPGTMDRLGAEAKQIAGFSGDHSAVEALVTRLVAASNANDVKAFAEVFAVDADFTNVVDSMSVEGQRLRSSRPGRIRPSSGGSSLVRQREINGGREQDPIPSRGRRGRRYQMAADRCDLA